ncbi:MAG: DUF502 domain-containing protein [candidate division Zixibacteria bacterium]|nr:DUF502 domain-containing protein [candidate division Zixibacteria bacterium]
MGFANESKNILRTRFISGLLVVVPVILTFVLLRALVEAIDSLLGPAIIKILGHSYDFPFVGVIATAMIIILSGIFTANIIGHRLVKLWERQILKIPVINFVYGSAKQLVRALTVPQSKSFKSVVMVEYPRLGVYALGFLVNETILAKPERQQRFLNVFIPSTPTPISGVVILFPEKDVEFLDMTIEEGVKFFVSGSIISPSILATKSVGGKRKLEIAKEKSN